MTVSDKIIRLSEHDPEPTLEQIQEWSSQGFAVVKDGFQYVPCVVTRDLMVDQVLEFQVD